SSGLSHDESFVVNDLDLNLNEEPDVNLNVCQVETQSKLPMSKELDDGRTQEPILAEVSIQEPIVAEYNGEFKESARSDRQFLFDDEGIDTEYDVQSSEDAGTNDDDDNLGKDFLVDEENEIVEPDVDVNLFGISMDLPFDNIGVTNLVSHDVLEEEDVDVINLDGFDSDHGNDEETNYRKRRNLKLYKNDGVRIRARCDGKVFVFTMSHGDGPTGPNRRMESGPSGSSGPTTRSKKRKNTCTNADSQASSSGLDAHNKGDLCPWVLYLGKDKLTKKLGVKAVQDQLQRELEVQISMSKAFKAKAKAEREIRGDHVLKVFQRIYVCLEALKLGFRACKGDMLGLDGAFMKGPFPGQVLVAVGLNLNNGIYPLAYALVEAEMIDKRQACKDLLWRAASATNVRDFEKYMLELKTMNAKAHEWLNKIPTEYWARSYFSGREKSNLLLNNICEVFNGKIVRGRDKLVITLLKYIKEYCMNRIVDVQGVIDKCISPLTPTTTRIMESIKKEAHLIKMQWNRANKYEVLGSLGDQCVVDVVTMTCSCRKWELTGIPCKHVVAACWNMALNDRAAPPPQKHRTKYWEKSTCPTILLPPKHLSRTITCKSCGNTGHNKATCKGQGRKATTDGNNAEASGSASWQAQQTKPAAGQDGSGRSSVGAVIGLSTADGEGGQGGAGVASQGSSHSRWTKSRVQTKRMSPQKRTPTQPASQPSTSSQVPVSETRM
nr:hypothetical protein [Tanacetum cinerariifolium]